MNKLPILYSFRRCPYAMRARIALALAGMPVELREVDLKQKPDELIDISPKGTVPVLLLPDSSVIEESLEIIDFVLPSSIIDSETTEALINHLSGEMVPALMRYKYSDRYDDVDVAEEKEKICHFLNDLDTRLSSSKYLISEKISKADIALFPFIRQLYKVDLDWFSELPYEHLRKWLNDFLNSDLHQFIMQKYPVWHSGQEPTIFSMENQ